MSLFEDNNEQTISLDALVGEGKKYKTTDDAAKAIVEKDRFIDRLKSEAEELRRELTARPAVDRSQEILDRLEALNTKPVTERPPHTEPERTEVKGLSVDDIEDVLNKRERKLRAQANIDVVKTELVKKFGPDYGKALKSLAEKNGLNQGTIDALAAESPQFVLSLIGQEKSEALFTPPTSGLTAQFTPTAGNPRNRKYYEGLKATDRTKYFSAEVQQQMYKDAMSLKEDFEA